MVLETMKKWHLIVKNKDHNLLNDILADDAKMHSPVVHTVQKGKAITAMYLAAAADILANDSFHYVREVIDNDFALLEFETNIDGILVNGVDMISFNEQGKIIDFKVMIRPLQGINIVHKKMAGKLEQMKHKQ